MDTIRKKTSQSKLDNAIAFIGFYLIVAYCLLFSIFTRSFAHLHIQLPFLDFPIFVSEILLFVCLILFLLLRIREGRAISRWEFVGITFACWVLLKAGIGYKEYGSLAFRNAALFYYALFSVVGYRFFIFKKFHAFTPAFFLLLLLFIKLVISINNYYVFPYLILSLILLSKVKGHWMKYLLIVPILYVPTYYFEPSNFTTLDFFFAGGRARILGHLAAFLIIAFSLISFYVKVGSLLKTVFYCICVIALIGGFFLLADPNAIKSMVNLSVNIEKLNYYENKIKKRRENFKAQELDVQLYSSETSDLKDNFVSFLKHFNRSEMQIRKHKKEKLIQIAYAIEDEKMKSVKNVLDIIKKDTERLKKEVYDQFERKKQKIINEFTIQNEERITKMEGEYQRAYNEQLEDALQNAQKVYEKKIASLEAESLAKISEAVKKITDERKAKLLKAIKDLDLEDDISINSALRIAEKIDEQGNRRLHAAYASIYFRLFIWRDMIVEIMEKKAWLGVSFGQPQRSESIEMLGWTMREWSRDGWTTPHNSYLHMIYRAGIFGLALVLGIWVTVLFLLIKFIQYKSLIGVFLTSIITCWTVMATFLLFLEFPYSAIPFWGLLGVTVAYYQNISKNYIQDKAA